jgi:redox-sensitive bicupin YhaK (pirin superfamily)
MNANISAVLNPHTKNLGDFEVRRLLPGHPDKMVGPFIFFDHMGPVDFAPGHGIDVRPHPHIGLATVTYLFEGDILHRDSLGSVQRIAPGDVNWMTAGRKAHEAAAPSFTHLPKSSLPLITLPGVQLRLIAGTAFGQRAPTPTFSEMFYLAAEMQAGAAFELPAEHAQRAAYIVAGDVSIAGEPVAPYHMAVLGAGRALEIRAKTAALIMLLGGEPMDGDRIIWWNFVASSQQLIEDAKLRWREKGFPPIPGETEFIPLPER